MRQLLGVILCGGESRRMGRDKGLIEKDGTIWALHMAGKLRSADLPVVFSINATQIDAYAAHIPSIQLIVDDLPGVSIAGPLKGLLSVHERFPGADLFLLACDMLDVDAGTIRTLIDAWNSAEQNDFYVYAKDNFAQPFCGIYTASGLAPIHTRALQNQLIDFSLQSLLRNGRTMRLPILREEAFRNYNTL